jgi:hypothetical protein
LKFGEDRIFGGKKKEEGDTLSNYFDYISGTSTGTILAARLSMGWTVDQLSDFYEQHGNAMFDKASIIKRLSYRYDDELLAELLQKEMGADVTLNEEHITGSGHSLFYKRCMGYGAICTGRGLFCMPIIR